MYLNIVIFFCVIIISSCQLAENESIKDYTINESSINNKIKFNENNTGKPFGNIYRSDGFSKDVNSEWFQIAFDKSTNRILGIWYWTSNNMDKKFIEVWSQSLNEGGISLISGEILFQKEIIPFEIIEDRFMIVNDNKKQAFDYENVEENEL